MSNSAPKQDLVKATLRIDPGAGNKLTGNTGAGQVTGQNTGWNQKKRSTTSTYTNRVDYLKQHSQSHPFAEGLLRGHGGDSVPEDTRGVSCAEGNAVLTAHQHLSTRGNAVAQANFRQLQHSVFTNHAQEQELPKTRPNPWTDKPGFNAFEQKQTQVRQQTAETMNSLLSFTGASSWQEYAKMEADYLAWNDIQKHGQFTAIKHDEQSDISPGQAMEPCTQCSQRITQRMDHKPK